MWHLEQRQRGKDRGSASDEAHEHVDDLRAQLGRALSGKERQNVDNAMDRGYGRRVPTQPPGVIAETDG